MLLDRNKQDDQEIGGRTMYKIVWNYSNYVIKNGFEFDRLKARKEEQGGSIKDQRKHGVHLTRAWGNVD